MKRSINLNIKEKSKKQKTPENIFFKEETSLLSTVDTNILQNIFTELIYGYEYSVCDKQATKRALSLVLNFPFTCKIFFNISKQPLFPLTLNNIDINLNYKKYLKILFSKQEFEQNDIYTEKHINALFVHNCQRGYYDTITTLIKYGANVNYQQGWSQCTPLITTISDGHKINTVKKLLKEKTIDVNQSNRYGKSPLSRACLDGNEDIVNILLARKEIDITLKDEDGNTALDTAKTWKQNHIIKMLQNYENSNLK